MKKVFIFLISTIFLFSSISFVIPTSVEAQQPDICKTATSADIIQACADYVVETQKLQDLQNQLSQQKQKTGSIQKNVNALLSQISSTQTKIKNQIININNLSIEIGKKVKAITELGNELDRQHASMGQLLKQTDELDQKGAAYVLLSSDSISSFFQDLDSFFIIKKSLYASVNKVKQIKSLTEDQKSQLQDKQSQALDAKSSLEFQKQQIQASEQQAQTLLKTNQNQQKQVEATVAQQQQKVSQIESKLFQLAGGGKAISFQEAYTYATTASNYTGVRVAFILAILTQESNLGKNVGTCNRAGDPVSKSWRNVMNPNRDQAAFIRITGALGMNPDTTPISCPIAGGGWGGGMGPSQFIPSTWELVANRTATALGVPASNPWNPRDAVMAAAIYLKDIGAVGNETVERNSACRYYSGRSCDGRRPPNSFYGNSVMALARSIQTDVDYLKQYGISRR